MLKVGGGYLQGEHRSGRARHRRRRKPRPNTNPESPNPLGSLGSSCPPDLPTCPLAFTVSRGPEAQSPTGLPAPALVPLRRRSTQRPGQL